MPGRSSSRYAVLGILTLEPMSGYDIKKFIETSVAHFWRESYGNLYPLLNRLTDEKLVRRRTKRQKGKPDRHVYSLTDRGRAAFLEWLGEPAKEDAVRSELLLKLFFGRHLEPGRLEAHLEEYRVVQARILGAKLRGHGPFVLALGQHRLQLTHAGAQGPAGEESTAEVGHARGGLGGRLHGGSTGGQKKGEEGEEERN